MTSRVLAALAICAGLTTAVHAQTPAPTTKPMPPAAAEPVSPAKPASLVDINSASLDELQKLKGIGKSRAEAIVKSRPYKGKDELLEKKILPKSVYDEIKEQIVARQKK